MKKLPLFATFNKFNKTWSPINASHGYWQTDVVFSEKELAKGEFAPVVITAMQADRVHKKKRVGTMKAYRIPDRDTMPLDDMIDFLADNPLDWEGDSEGIVLHMADGEFVLGDLGDWIVEIGGVYSVKKHEWMMQNVHLGMDFTKYEGPDPA